MLNLRKNSHFESFVLPVVRVSAWEGMGHHMGPGRAASAWGWSGKDIQKGRRRKRRNLICFHAFYWYLRALIQTLDALG